MKQTKGKRILSGFLDFVFVAFLMVIISSAATVPIANRIGLNDAGLRINFMTNDCGLYELSDQGTYYLISNEALYPEALYRYYVGFPPKEELGSETYSGVTRYSSGTLSPRLGEEEKNTAELYYQKILHKGEVDCLFDFSVPINELTPWKVSFSTENKKAVSDLYKEEFAKAHQSFLQNKELIAVSNKALSYYFIALLIGFYVSAFILISIVPLFIKNGRTLGMLITQSHLANIYGYKVSKPQVFLRQFSAFLLYYLLFFLPVHVVSMVMIFVNKNRRSLVDLIAATDVYDNDFLIYKDANEQYEYNVKLAKILAAQNKRRREIDGAKKQKYDEEIGQNKKGS
jgi:hypothetical protein